MAAFSSFEPFEEKIFEFIEKDAKKKNPILYLQQYETNKKPFLENLKDWQNANPECKFFDFMEKVFDNITYVDADTCDRIYRAHAQNIKKKLETKEISKVCIVFRDSQGQNELRKSNFFFNLFLCKLLLYDFDVSPHQISMTLCNKIRYQIVPDTATMYILCDDISYSGTQIEQYVDKLEKKKISNIYLCLVGYTKNAQKKITKTKLQLRSKIDFGESIFFENIKLFRDIERPLNSDLYLTRDSRHKIDFFSNPDLTLLYPFFKIPDNLSTFLIICGIQLKRENPEDGRENLVYYKSSSSSIRKSPRRSPGKKDGKFVQVQIPPGETDTALKLIHCDVDQFDTNEMFCNHSCINPFYRELFASFHDYFGRFFGRLALTEADIGDMVNELLSMQTGGEVEKRQIWSKMTSNGRSKKRRWQRKKTLKIR